MTSEPDFDEDFFLDRNHADVHREGEDEHERRFREACREIKDIRRHFDESEVDEFFTKYGDVINQCSNKTTANLLHTLVDVVTHNEVQPEHIEILVRRVVENFPDLLTHPNEETYNPIFLAIKASHDELVDYMITTCASKTGDTPHGQSLNDALSMKMKDGKTCLHLAITKRLSPRTIKALIEYASDEALAVQDDDGKTPMHHATLFKSCTDTGIELIKLFLERDIQIRQSKLRPPKTFLDATDNSGASVYWQLHTNRTSVTNAYNDWLAKKSSTTDTSKKNQQPISRARAEASLTGDNMPQMGSRLSRSSAFVKPVERYGQDYEVDILDIREQEHAMKKDDNLKQPAMFTIAAEIKKRGAENRNTSQDRSNMTNGHYAGMERFVDDRNAAEITSNISLKRRGTESLEAAQGREKERLASNSSPKKPNSSEFMPILTKNSNAILLDLKIHYMRTRSTELAISFLHGINMQDIHISFDYDSLPRKLLWHEFLKRFGSSKSGRLTFDNVLQYVTLPRVTVDVTGRLADIEREAEEESGLRQIGALGRKDAKYFLDWLFDKGVRHIISLSVEDGGRSDEKVHSDQVIQESLGRLIVEHLDWQKIDLDPETILRVGYTENTSLSMTYESVEVMMVNSDNEEEKISTSDAGLPFTTPSIVRDVNPHKWLDTTARFASEMTPFWQKTVKEFLTSKGNPATTEGVETDVIVALIDDGVDMFDTALSDRVVDGKSFDYHDGKVRPPFSSAQGHGTVMASMILSMCPMAKVYPIRLRTHLNANGKRNIDADYAAQAVDRKVLMFCSAPDDGKFTELDYPSGPWPDHFFRIGAAAADGTIFKWTPEVGITYVLPGVEVVVNRSLHARERLTKRVDDFKYETGSSVATALAAGLAAMIIYCIKASILTTKLANQNRDPIVGIAIADNDANMIANPEAMKRAFARLGRVTNAKFIQIWEKLDHVSDTLEVLNGRELKPEERLKYLKEFIDFGCDLAGSIRA
ncbi:hypothetical protein Trihar35433_2080 [Trichoderma harzianum]|nr:hypothetical protein Trihar35433_2080 [Trichoderma harzianum]